MTQADGSDQAMVLADGGIPLPLALRLGTGAVQLEPQGCDVPSGVCRVWLLPLAADDKVADALLPLLANDERAKANAYRAPSARRRFVQVRGALRLLLGRCLHVSAASISFDYGEFGKPMLAQGGAWHFNVAHSGGYALLAVANGPEVGVDIEQHRDLPDLEDLARTVLSPSEAVAWHGLPMDERVPGFFAAWAGKEAVAKATGQGLGLGLERLDVGVGNWNTQSSPRLVWDGASAACQLFMLPAPAGYAAALAARAAPG